MLIVHRCWMWCAAITLGTTVALAGGPDLGQLKAAREKGVKFLAAAQSADGGWTAPNAPGVSGLVVYGMLSGGAPVDHPAVQKGLKHLETFIQPDGGVYNPEAHHSNYETAIVILAFNAANKNGDYTKQLKAAEAKLRKAQWDEDEVAKDDLKYGGAGYGRQGDRPDLSNTAFFLEALQASGAKADDPAVQKAIVFLSRCQNLESEHNNSPFAAKINDGGFFYTPAAGGSSQAGGSADQGLRSYGSMTYAGLKSFVYAGLTPDDPRVKGALGWIAKNYTLEENPGMGTQGHYYYFQIFAKAMDAVGKAEFTDSEGQAHDWRKELAEKLFSLQKENGSWANPNARWMEGDPNLATAFALIALKYCEPPKK